MNTVVSQALACGLAVITTRHSGLPEQVVDGVNGYLVDEGDWRALAERIAHVAAHPDVLPAMSEAGHRHAEAQYNSPTLIERQIQAYQELARASR